MELKLQITTPQGQAKATEKKIKPFLLGARKVHATYTNKEDSIIYWEIHTNPRDAIKIQRNILLYGHIIRSAFENKLVRKIADSKLSKEDNQQLKDMLLHQTKIIIIKAATAEEIVESDTTFWERIKKTFTRAE